MKKGQLSDTFKLMIVAVVTTAILGVVLAILMHIGLPEPEPQPQLETHELILCDKKTGECFLGGYDLTKSEAAKICSDWFADINYTETLTEYRYCDWGDKRW